MRDPRLAASSHQGFFITGTDTGVGKTWVTLHLMDAFQAAGFTCLGMKPVATGASRQHGRLANRDALELLQQGSRPVPYERINPYVYEAPVSPHIAAKLEGQPICLARIVELTTSLLGLADCLLVEGIGGWRVPLNSDDTVADLAVALGFPVILVVGLRLGCINHGVLTQAAIRESGAVFGGWVANHVVPDYAYPTETIDTLCRAFGNEPLAEMAYVPNRSAASGLDYPSRNMADMLRRLLA
jgi:dethiobiotin synthetase